MPDWINLVQWPAMAASIAAAFLVGSSEKKRRNVGFWIFLVSNFLWLAWGIPENAWALVTLQVALGAMNVRGMLKTESK